MELNPNNILFIEAIGRVLIDEKRPLKERFRALFTLRNLGGEHAVRCIEKCFDDTSALLKHECAYCLGQMQDASAVPKLQEVLNDVKEDPIVRHEAAEALAAIGQECSVPILRKYINDPCLEVAQTCQLALSKMQIKDVAEKELSENPYHSVDPAPPLPIQDYGSVNDLERIFLNESEPLFNRYRAMFSLRNTRTSSAALALAKGLKSGSALFRHEVAYVLGQMQMECTAKYLADVLFDEMEHEMVRHECAEALGAIANEECMEILKLYAKDKKRIVRESCEVAIDMCSYENGEEFQYANTVSQVVS